MSHPCVIEINDIALSVADRDGLRLSSPACAVLDGHELLLGEAALARARLNPRQTHDRFWAQLDQQPLHRPAGHARSHADLAWFHLKAIWQQVGRADDEAIIAVPPDWDHQQLALMLGIAQACDIRVVGLVAAPVAAASVAASRSDDAIYLDAQRQRIRGTDIGGGREHRLGSSRELSRRGLAALHDSWAALIAEQFVHETRFDPMQHASSEQLLYTRLPAWQEALRAQDAASIELGFGQHSYRLRLSQQALVERALPDYTTLIDALRPSHGVRVMLGHRLAELPGLVREFSRQGLAFDICTADAITRGVLQHFDVIRSDPSAPDYVTRLPSAIASRAGHGGELRDPPRAAPTHLLRGWRAFALGATALALHEAAPPALTAGAAVRVAQVRLHQGRALLRVPAGMAASVNGESVAGEVPLYAGDLLRLGEDAAAWHCIVVADGQE